MRALSTLVLCALVCFAACRGPAEAAPARTGEPAAAAGASRSGSPSRPELLPWIARGPAASQLGLDARFAGGLQRTARVDTRGRSVEVRCNGVTDAIPVEFWPTGLASSGLGDLAVAGVDASGSACIEAWRFATGESGALFVLSPVEMQRVLTEPDGGARGVRWILACAGSKGGRALFQLVDRAQVEELDLASGERRVVAAADAEVARARGAACAALAGYGLEPRGVVDRGSAGFWHVLQTSAPRPRAAASVLLLIDGDRDGAIDDVREVSADGAALLALDVWLADDQPRDWTE